MPSRKRSRKPDAALGGGVSITEEAEFRQPLVPRRRDEGVNAMQAEFTAPALRITRATIGVIQAGIEGVNSELSGALYSIERLGRSIRALREDEARMRKFIDNIITGEWTFEQVKDGCKEILEEPNPEF